MRWMRLAAQSRAIVRHEQTRASEFVGAEQTFATRCSAQINHVLTGLNGECLHGQDAGRIEQVVLHEPVRVWVRGWPVRGTCMSESDSGDARRRLCRRPIGVGVVHGHMRTWRHQGRFQGWPACTICGRVPCFKPQSALFHAPYYSKIRFVGRCIRLISGRPRVCRCRGHCLCGARAVDEGRLIRIY